MLMAGMTTFETMWPIFWHFFVIVSAIRYPQKRCDQNDCSIEHPFQNASCLVHNTEVCMHYMSNFTKAAEISLESEEEAKFSVFISPYTAQVNIENKTWNFSAINISFVIHKEGVDSLALKINHNNDAPRCRILDFRKQRFFSLPVSFFYDCLYYLAEANLQNVQMDIISLPSNEHLSYYVYIPHVPLKNTPCDWQPVIMVFCGSLAEGLVKVKFTPPPSQLNISFCTVELVGSSSNEIISNVVSCNKTEDILVTEFASVSYGNYAVVVKPYLENCQGTKTEVFQVGNPKPVLDIITGVCICIIIVFIICSFAVYRFCYLSHKLKLTVKRALLVYSYDNQRHEDFVTAFVSFLNETSNLEVSTIYGEASVTGEDYLKEEFSKADLVIFLISQGFLMTLDNPRITIGIGHKWLPPRLPESWRILHKDFCNKKICKIRFSYSKNLQISDSIQNGTGQWCFNLPEDFNRFMSFAHDLKTPIFSSVLCPLFAVDLNSSKVYKNLDEKLKLVPVADENNVVVRISPKEKMEDSEPQESSDESVSESELEQYYLSKCKSELSEGGNMNSTANFEGISDDVSSAGEDQPFFYGNSPDYEGEIIKSDEFYRGK